MYVCGLVIPVPEGGLDAYRAWAESGAAFFKEYGCLEIVESWEDFVPNGKQTDFRKAVAAQAGGEDRLHLAGLARQTDFRSGRGEDARGSAHGLGGGAAVRRQPADPGVFSTCGDLG